MNREQALNLLHEYTKTDSLRKHAYAVEAAMRAYAGKFGEDEETWGIVGLLHDFDYEQYPTEHPMKGAGILEEKGLSDQLRRVIISHVPRMNVPRDTKMAKALFACDELCGFLVACALVRPAKLVGLEPSSVKKKLKDKAFARTVSREDIQQGVADLGIPAEEHIAFLVDALAGIQNTLGLA